MAPLGQLAQVVSGESFSASQTTDSPTALSRPVLGIKNLGDDGGIDLNDVTHVEGLERDGLFTLDEYSLVVIRTNGNEDRIGNVYRPRDSEVGFALSAFTFGCGFHDVSQRDLAFEYMRGRRFQQWATSLVAGSTGLKNLPIRNLRTASIPVASGPSAEALEELGDVRQLEASLRRHAQRTHVLTQAIRERVLAGERHV